MNPHRVLVDKEKWKVLKETLMTNALNTDVLIKHGLALKDTHREIASDIISAANTLQDLRKTNAELVAMVTALETKIDKDAEYHIHRYYYEKILKAIADDEMLQDAWKDFIAIMKMRVPEPIPGLTEEMKFV